jgi:hypothetical protein
MSELGATRRLSPARESGIGLTARRADLLATGALLIVTVVAAWRLLGGGTLIGQDSATQFYPWYSYLGERLAEFEIPAWNPSQFSGAPFAADPQSGWTYLPAMVTFSALPLSVAVSVYLAFHLLLAAFGAYGLARALGIGPLGALATGIAYELSGPVFSRSVCCPAQLQVISWVPVVLVGLEMAINCDDWPARLRWMTVAAFGMSQIVASWIGQGSYYVALLGGAYVLYRGLVDSPSRSRSWRARGQVTLATGFGTALFTAGLSAAGVIPRLTFNRLSNVAGGVYQDQHAPAAVSGGWQAGETVFREVIGDPYYMGSVVIALATVSVLLARGRFATPFFTIVLVSSFILSASVQTPLHSLFYLVFPRFEDLHRHWPERIAMAGFIAIAVLAGAAVDSLPGWARKHRPLLGMAAIPVGIVVAFAIGLRIAGDGLPAQIYAGVAIVAGALLIVGFGRNRTAVVWMPMALVALLTVELLSANAAMLRGGPYGGYHEVDVQRYLQPSNAALFLSGQQGTGPFRFFGFDPRLQQMAGGWPVYYRYQFANERTRSLVVNNRATLHGLHDVQGYNPVQLQDYVEAMTLLNGEPQDYHDANVMPAGLESPLLDLLNARYLVVPSEMTSEQDELLLSLSERYPVVFDDGYTRVLERESALPRAWIVHAAETVDGAEALRRVVAGEVDPRQTALIDGVVPTLQDAGSSEESAAITTYEPERIVIQTDSTTAGMLLLSEMAYPAWKATVDGVPVDVSTAYGLIRAIPLPAGSRIVEFSYDTQDEELGLVLTFGTVILLGAMFAGMSARRRWLMPADRPHHR